MERIINFIIDLFRGTHKLKVQYLSTKDYAELVGLSESTIRKKCQQNKLPHVVEKYNNRDVYRVKVDDTFPSNIGGNNGIFIYMCKL